MIDRAFFRTLWKSELFKNTSLLISGTVVAQLIPILLRPVMSRFFLPEVFGIYSVYSSIFGVICIMASLKYELAIVIPKSDKSATNILFLSFFINIAFTSILTIVLILWGRSVCKLINIPDSLSYYIFFVPAGTFLYTFYQSISYWLIRKKQFMALSYNKIFRRGFEGLIQFVMGILSLPFGLIAGDIVGHVSNVLSGLYQSAKSGLSLRILSFNRLRYVFKKYSEFPKFNMFPSLLSAVSFMLPVIIVNKFFSSEFTGFLDMSRSLLSIPLVLIASSLASVLLQRLSEKRMNNEGLLRDLLSVLLILVIIALLEIVVIEIFGVKLFELLFGKKWGFSGEISRILVWSYAFNFIVSSFSGVFISLNKIKILSLWQVLYFISILSLFIFKDKPFIDFLKIYVAVEIICYSLYSLLLFVVVRNYELQRKVSIIDKKPH
jgi:O-antigen/teichoic acid export membrane protein